MTTSKTDGKRINSRFLKFSRSGASIARRRKNGKTLDNMVEVIIPVGKPNGYGKRALLKKSEARTVKHLLGAVDMALGHVYFADFPGVSEARSAVQKAALALIDSQDGTPVTGRMSKDGRTVVVNGKTFIA